MPKSAYIHIPFCQSKCKYCSFVSFCSTDSIVGYTYSLLKEISENYQGEKLNTLYFGGGTPSLLPVDLLRKIINKFKLNDDSEVTIEVNPDDADEAYFSELRKMGFNRISIGSQTFDDNILKLIGRRHDSSQIFSAVEKAKRAGFSNISLDLIYGLPAQTIDGFSEDLRKITNLDIQHVSTYGLKIEQNSFFGKNVPENLPDDDTQADMYELVNDFLEKNGFYRYEISNFAKMGFESRHNTNYWNNDEYYGFGVAAHGYVDGVRYSNYGTLEEYLDSPATHEYGKFLTAQEKLEEEIFLGFRKTEGINTTNINKKFGINFDLRYGNILAKHSDYIEKTRDGYRLNLNGILLSNVILADFIE